MAWGLVAQRVDVMLFFLGCVVVAGLYGGWSVSQSQMKVQALPAALAIAAVLLAY
ncbi:DUF1304 family protein [Pantoea dispersa]|uniref:DUF1304 family protein n=1 Tax=Pantoea dispersa TaxID=59814 RepID=UPI0035A573FD